MTYTEKEKDLIVADSFKELGYKQKKLLLASFFEGNPDRQKYADALIKNCGEGVYNRIKEKFKSEAYRTRVLQKTEESGVACITLKSGDYPEQLKATSAPPLVLYASGNLRLLKDELFGVVGSRRTTPQAAELCKRVVEELTSRFTVVTGVADGGDSAAISAALGSGRVICVLPCGHGGQCSGNPAIFRQAEKKGLLVSEYPPGTPAYKYAFLVRNRIIAGLSKGVLVISAAEKSGALNTAAYAADYGRDVFAFPYFVGVDTGKGCNALIKSGAYLVEGADDIFSVYGLTAGEKKAVNLTEEERRVLELLKDGGELHAEKLAAALGKKTFEVMVVCSALEIKGLIVRTGGNKFTAV